MASDETEERYGAVEEIVCGCGQKASLRDFKQCIGWVFDSEHGWRCPACFLAEGKKRT